MILIQFKYLISDDSDHHYESMYAGNYDGQSKAHLGATPAPQNLDIMPFDDDEFDSFDSDLEDEDMKKVSHKILN